MWTRRIDVERQVYTIDDRAMLYHKCMNKASIYAMRLQLVKAEHWQQLAYAVKDNRVGAWELKSIREMV